MDGYIFYSKTVLGKDSKPFTINKFRTMIPNAEKLFHTLVKQNGFCGHGKINSDPRITNIGKLMRTYFIDEAPQVYNIIKGEMNIVGVRPRSEEDWSISFPEKHKKIH